MECFAKFKQYFNDVPDRKIVLTFNNIDPDKQPDAYNWVMTQLDPAIGFGMKGGAYNRGHHLSDEQTFKEQWTPFLINPKVSAGNPNGVKLFSASEMDQSWTKGYFALNYEIGFYWAALGGLNTGVSCTNVSVSAMQYAFANPGIIETFKMYNKYAQQVYPETATTAFSVFHEGLNAADKVKFKESDYGNATQSNTLRYQNICNSPKYYNRGARLEDPAAVVLGQVAQREFQDFYNDAGWEICEGNIERFMTQINPDDTSIGLFRVRGPITASSSKYDRFARSFENSSGKNTMYFKLDNQLAVSNKALRFVVRWLDKTQTTGSTWSFQYRNASGLQTIPFSGAGTNVNQWKTETITISDAIINQGGTLQSDFMLVNMDTTDDIFNGIEMNILQDQTINFNALPSKKVGDADFSPGATSTSGSAITYTSSNPNVATIVGDKIHIVGSGSCIITASQVGDNYYHPASSVSQYFSVTTETQTTITTTGTWICPAGATSIKVEVWGGGGSGGTATTGGVGGGGAGGAYVINNNVAVVPGSSYSITVGAGGIASTTATNGNGTAAGATIFLSTTPVIANGGVAGGNATGTGALNTAFGLGGINLVGGSGGTVTLGSAGDNGAASSGGKGGDGANGGGAGGAADTSTGNVSSTGLGGNNGTAPGGGGSGAFGTISGSRVGGTGGAGQIKITYTVVPNSIFSNGTGGGFWSATTTWAGGVVPSENDYVSILGSDAVSVNSTGAICNNLIINANGSLTINTDKYLTVKNTLTNNGTITLENNANLIQTAIDIDTNSGSGIATVKRNSNPLKRLDYTLWSSPVSGSQTLAQFSPLTSQSPNRFYTYDTTSNLYATTSASGTFLTGTGYLIRMPNTNPLIGYDTGLATLSYQGEFLGTLNNGTNSVLLTTGYNLVGNPYPSNISFASLRSENSSLIGPTAYFWRKTNAAVVSSAYCTYNTSGSPTYVSNGQPGAAAAGSFDGIIQSGQGFFVNATTTGTLNFTNTQRTTTTTNQAFFKTKQVAAADKLWLNATNAAGDFSQMAVTYSAGATTGLDDFDSKFINDSGYALISNIEGGEYTIQGRPAFDATDVVVLNFKTITAGDYTIALAYSEGVFTNGQDIYLVDSKTGIETNLKAGSYTFSAVAGVDNARFSLKYQKTLKVDTPAFSENSVRVYKNKGTLYVNSGNVAISNIKVFDIQGRLIAEQKNVKATTASINNLKATNQVLIVKIIAENNEEDIKKIVN